MLEVDMLDLHILDVGMLEVHLQKGLKSVEAEQEEWAWTRSA
jgi:hypothetical protein